MAKYLKKYISRERLFALLLILLGVIGLYGSFNLNFYEKYTLGPGAFPLIYSIGLIICSICLFIKSKDKKFISLRSFFVQPALRGLIFFLLLFLMAGLIYYFGFLIPLFIFSIVGLIWIEDWRFSKAFLFSSAWILFVYILFVKLLKVKLLQGIFF